jgi:hypothetical protein
MQSHHWLSPSIAIAALGVASALLYIKALL